MFKIIFFLTVDAVLKAYFSSLEIERKRTHALSGWSPYRSKK
jgi:hypothetical protein